MVNITVHITVNITVHSSKPIFHRNSFITNWILVLKCYLTARCNDISFSLKHFQLICYYLCKLFIIVFKIKVHSDLNTFVAGTLLKMNSVMVCIICILLCYAVITTETAIVKGIKKVGKYYLNQGTSQQNTHLFNYYQNIHKII